MVGVVLAGPRDGELGEARRQRGEDGQQEQGDHVAALLPVAPAAAEPQRDGGYRGDDAGDAGGDGAGEDVAVVDVGQLVAQDPAQLALVEQLE